MFDLVRELNRRIEARSLSTADAARALEALPRPGPRARRPARRRTTDLEPDAAALLDERVAARAARDWAASDRLRDELLAHGIAVEDTRDGQRWRRVDGGRPWLTGRRTPARRGSGPRRRSRSPPATDRHRAGPPPDGPRAAARRPAAPGDRAGRGRDRPPRATARRADGPRRRRPAGATAGPRAVAAGPPARPGHDRVGRRIAPAARPPRPTAAARRTVGRAGDRRARGRSDRGGPRFRPRTDCATAGRGDDRREDRGLAAPRRPAARRDRRRPTDRPPGPRRATATDPARRAPRRATGYDRAPGPAGRRPYQRPARRPPGRPAMPTAARCGRPHGRQPFDPARRPAAGPTALPSRRRSAPTRSWSPVAARSRRRSSPRGRRSACWSSRSVGTRSRSSCSTRRACASRSSRSKADADGAGRLRWPPGRRPRRRAAPVRRACDDILARGRRAR